MTDPGSYENLRDRTLSLFAPLTAIAGARSAAAAVTRLAAAHARLRDSTLTVVVCGEFKRGKSSLLNALLEERTPLFPVDAAVATSVVTVVSYGPTERIMVALEDREGGLVEKEIDRASIREYVTEDANPGNTRFASLVSAEVPNRRLESGIVLVDTPGVGGVFRDHTAATTSHLPGADAVVFVCDFTQPLMASELAFLRQASAAARIVGDADGLIVVVTKSDLLDADERATMLANAAVKLVEVTGRPAEELTIVPVSSHEKRAYLATGAEARLAASGFPHLEEVLWSAVSRRRVRVILGAALAELAATAGALLDPLDAEVGALEADTAATLADLRATTGQRQAELAELESERSAWRTELHEAVRGLGQALRVELVERLDAAWHRLDVEYLFDDDLVADPQRIVSLLDSEAGMVAAAISELATRRAAEIQRDFARAHALELSLHAIGPLPAPPVPDLTVTGRLYEDTTRDRRWDKAREASQSGSVGGGLGAMVGGFAGALIGGLLTGGLGAVAGAQLGASLGGLGGIAAGVRKGIVSARDKIDKSDTAARRRSITTELAPLRRSQPLHLTKALTDLVDQLGRAILVELDSRIGAQRETAGEVLARLDEAARTTRADAAARLATLDKERRPLREIRSHVDGLARAASRFGSPVRRPQAAGDPDDGARDEGAWADE